MSQSSVELSRASGTATLRGVFLIGLGAIAVRWPDDTLLFGLVAAGAIAGTLGLLEIAGALASTTLLSSRVFYLGDGLVFVGFGVLTVSVPIVAPRAAAALTVTWLLLFVLYAALLAARVWYRFPVREALLFWGLVNVGFSLAVMRLGNRSHLVLLYWGALYTTLLGFAEVVAGAWINKYFITSSRRDAAATRVGSPRTAAR